MAKHEDRDERGSARQEEGGAQFRFPTAPNEYDRMLAAAYDLSLDVLSSPATAPVIDTNACAAWLAADLARDRRVVPRETRRGAYPDRRQR